jgi:acyl-CoA dehydrogenase
LIPTSHKGVNIGRRHIPLGAAFMNGPNWGKDVFIPMDWVIGGSTKAGQGWRMLVECLAAGRSISLPSMSMAAGKLASRATGAYARVRAQFKTPIGKFEGVEEALARIGGNTYMMDATRRMTMVALDSGEKPSVISAICKYHMTERMRTILNDAMDVHGGKGIMMGPNNYLGHAYMTIPIAITVEGANILTRSMIIFGQGAIRCHPFVLKEIDAAGRNDLAAFDAALFGHFGFTLSNAARSLWLGFTGGIGYPVPGTPETRRYMQQMARFSAAFALLSDVSMFVIGGALKRKEMISARLGDILSLLYMASATVKRFHDEGRKQEDLPLLTWSMWDSFFRIQVAMEGVVSNFPNKLVGAWLRMLVFPKGTDPQRAARQVGQEGGRDPDHAGCRARSADGGRVHPEGRERRDRAPGVRDGGRDQVRSHRGPDAQGAEGRQAPAAHARRAAARGAEPEDRHAGRVRAPRVHRPAAARRDQGR